jgi:hypothetical protein
MLVGDASVPDVAARGLVDVDLPDFAPAEALDAFAAWSRDPPGGLVTSVVPSLGGVPELIRTVALADLGEEASSQDVIEVLSSIGVALRETLTQVGKGYPSATARFCALANQGPCTQAHEADDALVAAGMVRRREGRLALRAPVFAEWAIG